MTSACEKPRESIRPAVSVSATSPLMLTAADVAALLVCSTKTVYRLNDRGAMPVPVRIGGLLRWPRAAIEQWIAEGCPPPETPRPRPRNARG